MFDQIKDVVMELLGPIIFMSFSARYLPVTVFKLITNRQFSILFNVSAFKDAWFAEFWGEYGPGAREGATPNAQPLIEQARGFVLDIGPGSGEWLRLFDKSKITKIYGVEPNKDHHESLRKMIKEAGLVDMYEILPVGVEDMGGQGIQRESFDTVVTIQCLCSVREPRRMIQELYGYIKSGGQWIVYEHVITHQGGAIAKYQAVIDLAWPHFLGGCSLTRDTEKWLREAGHWSKIDLSPPPEEHSYSVLPRIMGILVK